MNKPLFYLACFTASLLVACVANAGCYSEGVRVGVIQKFSKKGTFTKSWEGELAMGGIKSNQSGFTNIWKFSATDQAVATQIDDAVMSGREVALKYCQIQFNIGTTDTDYLITKVVLH